MIQTSTSDCTRFFVFYKTFDLTRQIVGAANLNGKESPVYGILTFPLIASAKLDNDSLLSYFYKTVNDSFSVLIFWLSGNLVGISIYSRKSV